MSEWSSATIGDFFELITGYAFKSKEFLDRGVPVIKIKNVKAGDFSKHEFSYVDESFLRSRPNKLAKKDDLLISMSGNRHDGSPETWVGKVCRFFENDSYLINQRVGALRLKSGVKADVRFLSFLLSGWPFQERFIAIATSSGGQANLSPDQILGTKILFPDVETQVRIGSILGALDDKIELNGRMNETLEAMARALFKDWFVDFGPTRAKIEGREPYLAPHFWDLFPDTLNADGIPEGWKDGALADIANSPRRGISPSDVSEDTPYIGLEHMPRRSIALSEWEGAGKVTSNKSEFKKGELLFGKLRPYFHKVGIAPLDGICSTDIVVVVPNAEEWSGFATCCISSDEFVEYTNQTSTGTKMPRTSWKTMGQYKISIPSDAIAKAFQSLVRPFFDQIGANIHESQTLSLTRDLLLPKLMSGEIRLRDAEKQMEAVA